MENGLKYNLGGNTYMHTLHTKNLTGRQRNILRQQECIIENTVDYQFGPDTLKDVRLKSCYLLSQGNKRAI